MLKKLKYLFILPILLALTGCVFLSSEPKPNPNYNNTKYFNRGWHINIPGKAEVDYFCYSTWTSSFSFGGGNYAVYTLAEPLNIKWNNNKSEEFERYFLDNVNLLLDGYMDEASYGNKEMPDFNNEYIWRHLGEGEDPSLRGSEEFKKNNGNVLSCIYFSDTNKLFVYSFAGHAVR